MTHSSVLDSAQLAIRARCDLKIVVQSKADGTSAYIVEDPLRHRYFRLGEAEYRFLLLLDEPTTIANAVRRMVEQMPNGAWNSKQALVFVRWLDDHHLLAADTAAHLDSLVNLERQSSAAKRWGRWNPLFLRMNLICPDVWLDRIGPCQQWLTGYAFLALWIVAMALGSIVLVGNWEQLWDGPWVRLDAQGLALLAIAWAGLKVWHELFHALVCKRFGGHVPRAGLMLILGMPTAFVDVSSTWQFPTKWTRIYVALAGMYAELFVAAIAIVVWQASDNLAVQHFMRDLVVLAGINSILFNGNPLVRLDAYYALSDWLEIPNLNQRARQSLVAWLVGHQNPDPSLSPRDRRWLLSYATAALAWRSFVGLMTVLLLTGLWGGWGTGLAGLFVFVSVLKPLGAAFQEARRLIASKPSASSQSYFFRPAIIVPTAVLLAYSFVPHSIRLPAIVEYSPEVEVRAGIAGFLSRIEASSGDTVDAGQTLVVLENTELDTEWITSKASAEQSRQKARLLLANHEMAKSQAETATLAALQKKVIDCDAQRSKCEVKSPSNGQFLVRRLDDRVGSWIETGDVIGVVGDPRKKQVIALIEQDEVGLWEDLLEASATMTTHRWLGRSIPSKLVRLSPRASSEIAQQALSATNHGPLPVQTDTAKTRAKEAPQEKYLRPMFCLMADLDEAGAATLPTGQVGWLHISTSGWKWFQHLSQSTARWVRCKVDGH